MCTLRGDRRPCPFERLKISTGDRKQGQVDRGKEVIEHPSEKRFPLTRTEMPYD